jgi:hypothetical protein
VLVALVLAGTAACRGRVKDKGPCPEGTAGCACDDSSCKRGLTCEAGYCAPTDCERGNDGCACFADGTCAPQGSVPMACRGNICRAEEPPAAGTLGGACTLETACPSTEDGAGACVNGICEIAACPSGNLGCPCGAFGACAPFGEAQVRCDYAGQCSIGDCTRGALGCACKSDRRCGAGLACDRGVCLSAERISIGVTSDTARACEVLLREGGSAPLQAYFSDEVHGRFEHRSPKLGVSFFARADQSLAGQTLAKIERADGSPLTRDGVQVVRSTCYDASGQTLPGSLITLD